MKVKSFNRNQIVRQIVPSVFFIPAFTICAFQSFFLNVSLIAGCIALVIKVKLRVKSVLPRVVSDCKSCYSTHSDYKSEWTENPG